MSDWGQYGFEEKIREILSRETQPEGRAGFGRPFITAYQLAIRLRQHYRSELDNLDWPVGGAGTDDYHSMARYVAAELARRIVDETISDIEGAFLSMRDGSSLTYGSGEGQITASPTNVVSMFRLHG